MPQDVLEGALFKVSVVTPKLTMLSVRNIIEAIITGQQDLVALALNPS